MTINSEKKVDILLAALGARYAALDKIRDRVESVGVWSMGLSLAAAAWLLQSKATLSFLTRGILILGTMIAFAAIRFIYFADLARGFRGQQRAVVRIEKALGLFTIGALDDAHDTIYPEAWRAAGTEDGHGKFFRSSYILLYIAAAFLVISILLSSLVSQPGGN